MLEAVPFQPQTSFVGREKEQRQIRERLAKADCRLLTIVGPGGIGKTQLALHVLSGLQENYRDGAVAVPLQSAASKEELITAIAEAVALPLRGQKAPQTQLFDYLQHKEMLLLLDNFEQLLEAAPLLSELLQVTQHVQLLVTSREVLNLKEEWLLPLAGLQVPSGINTAPPEDYSAVQLFVARARRVRPDFSLEKERAGVIRICQLVQGLPLALELAASWLKTLRCAAIAAEIQKSIDFLASDLRDVPLRHRSMEAVFQQTWEMLDEAEQELFQRLSVFRGGFTRSAAAAVAETTLPTLSHLLDKSLIVRRENGRYTVHELLRQYGAEKLAASPQTEAETRHRHCTYYACFMAERVRELNSSHQKEAAAAVAAELDNVRVAWAWAITNSKLTEISQMSSSFFFFCQLRSRFLEGANALGEAVGHLDNLPRSEQRDQTLARLLNHQGWLLIRIGAFDSAESLLARSCELFAQLDAPPPPFMGGDSTVPLGIVRLIKGQHDSAERLGRLARQAAEDRDDDQHLAFAHYLLTATHFAKGNYRAAGEHAQLACTSATAADNRWFLAYVLNEWGNVARALGEYAEARRHFHSSYQIKEQFEDPEGMAVALNHLGDIALIQGDREEAAAKYEDALAIYRELNDRGGRAAALRGLARVAAAHEEYDKARTHLSQALEIAYKIRFWPLVFSLLVDAGEHLLQTNAPLEGLKLLALAQRDPRSDHETGARARERLSHWQTTMRPEVFAKAVAQGEAAELAPLLAQLQLLLAEPLPAEPPAKACEQPLDEPLTERELEVLALLAAGHTNAEIADELVIATGTVKWYASQIYGKLSVSNRTEAAARARELNLLS